MKKDIADRITSVILFLTIIGIFSVLIVFSIIAIQEFWGEDGKIAFAESSENATNSSNEEKTVEDDIEAPEIVENPISKIESTSTASNNDYSNVKVVKYFYD